MGYPSVFLAAQKGFLYHSLRHTRFYHKILGYLQAQVIQFCANGGQGI